MHLLASRTSTDTRRTPGSQPAHTVLDPDATEPSKTSPWTRTSYSPLSPAASIKDTTQNGDESRKRKRGASPVIMSTHSQGSKADKPMRGSVYLNPRREKHFLRQPTAGDNIPPFQYLFTFHLPSLTNPPGRPPTYRPPRPRPGHRDQALLSLEFQTRGNEEDGLGRSDWITPFKFAASPSTRLDHRGAARPNVIVNFQREMVDAVMGG